MMRILGFILGAGAAALMVASHVASSSVKEVRIAHKVASNWGRTLDPAGLVPTAGYKAIYFDRANPRHVVFQENVESVAIKYAWSDFHGIASPSFGAYWIGRVKFAHAVRKEISISQSWAKSRVIIDGKTVFDQANHAGRLFHDFASGEHVIEVEYLNNWHTVEFKMTMQDVVRPFSAPEVAGYLRDHVSPSAKLYLAGLYESAAGDTSVDVTVPATGKPAILWLSSYEAIDWKIASRDPVEAVVVSSYAPGSRVRGRRIGTVLNLQPWPGLPSSSRGCSCAGGFYHCEQPDGLDATATRLHDLTGRPLAGYALAYSAQAVAIQPYDGAAASRAREQHRAEEQARQQCVGRANVDFDTLFK